MIAYHQYFVRSCKAEQIWTLEMAARDAAGSVEKGIPFLIELPKKEIKELLGAAAAKRASKKEWSQEMYHEKLLHIFKNYK
jgi:hypothetical protein